jgi:hypothetical protein
MAVAATNAPNHAMELTGSRKCLACQRAFMMARERRGGVASDGITRRFGDFGAALDPRLWMLNKQVSVPANYCQ